MLCERTRRRSTYYSQLQRLGATVALPLHCQYSAVVLRRRDCVILSGVGDRYGHDNIRGNQKKNQKNKRIHVFFCASTSEELLLPVAVLLLMPAGRGLAPACLPAASRSALVAADMEYHEARELI